MAQRRRGTPKLDPGRDDYAEIAGSGHKATAECRVTIPGVPGSVRGTAVIRGSEVDCGWQVPPQTIQAWKQGVITFRTEVVVRSNGRVARRSVTVRSA
jgi:hypothetical protein